MQTSLWVVLTTIILNFLSVPDACAAVDENISTADYVIVGVGTAGALMAKRLSDDKKTSVIALHNGEYLSNDPLIKYSKNAIFTVSSSLLGLPNLAEKVDLPAPLALLFANLIADIPPGVPFLYQSGLTTPQPNADNRGLLWVLSLPAGGASSINAGAWCRGTNELYAQWEGVAGPEWSLDRILETYKELEDYHGKTLNPEFRGFHGPIDVLQVKRPTKLSQKFNKAIIKGTEVPFVLDYNDPVTPIGASSQLQNTHNGCKGRLRVSSITAFLNGRVMKPNGKGVHGRKLRVFFNSTALRTIWEGNKAVGVEYIQNGEIKQVRANKGVIVCAGLFSSSFLMHSGVGPKPLLDSLNIPVVFDNSNVGLGLADQPQLQLVFLTNPADTNVKTDSLFSQIAFLPAPGGNPKIREVRFAVSNPIPGLALMVCDLSQPKSRGTITINSADPLSPPVINLGVFTNPSDLALYQAAFTIYVKAIVNQLQAIDPLYQLVFPDPAILDDILLLTTYIQENVASNQCFQSHCRMAPLDQGGVVDSTGHVYGVQNLIVADDSCVPVAIDGTTMASAYLMAANIARLLGY